MRTTPQASNNAPTRITGVLGLSGLAIGIVIGSGIFVSYRAYLLRGALPIVGVGCARGRPAAVFGWGGVNGADVSRVLGVAKTSLLKLTAFES